MAQQSVFTYLNSESSRPLLINYLKNVPQKKITKVVEMKDRKVTSSISIVNNSKMSNHDIHDLNWLMTQTWPQMNNRNGIIRSCDIFSGCGGITMGLWEASRNLGIKLEVVMGCDMYSAAKKTFVRNFSPEFFLENPIEQYIDGKLGDSPTVKEKELMEKLGRIDVVVGGPPCQGNSNLNNHTRGTDVKNELYIRMIRFIELFNPIIALIENVRGVVNATANVVVRSQEKLIELGYDTHNGVVKGIEIGVPQTRIRHFTIASKKNNSLDIFAIWKKTTEIPRTLGWVIEDISTLYKTDNFNSTPDVNTVNQKRMNYLINNNVWNLPNSERPDCHKNGNTYPAVYGRMYWDKPAPTLTTGFGCNGRGRFTHPLEARVLTPHEGARVQTFPDFFDFSDASNTELRQLIGNAVPPLMAIHILLPLLTQLLELK